MDVGTNRGAMSPPPTKRITIFSQRSQELSMSNPSQKKAGNAATYRATYLNRRFDTFSACACTGYAGTLMLLVKGSPLSQLGESSQSVLLPPGVRIHLWLFTQGRQCCFAHAARCIRRHKRPALCRRGGRGPVHCGSVLLWESELKSEKGIDKGGCIV